MRDFIKFSNFENGEKVCKDLNTTTVFFQRTQLYKQIHSLKINTTFASSKTPAN